MFKRLSDPKRVDNGKLPSSPSSHPGTHARPLSAQHQFEGVSLTQRAQAAQKDSLAMTNGAVLGSASDGTSHGPTRMPSTASAPTVSSAAGSEFMQLSQSPRATSFRSGGSNGSQSTAHTASTVPILSAEENVERVVGKSSRHGHRSPSKSEASAKKKKESKREGKDKRDSVKVTTGGDADGEGGPVREGSAHKKSKQGSMRRRPSVHSDQGSTRAADGGINKDDVETLNDAEDGPRPLSRHASTLSMRQQTALAKTPSFLSRTHTPPPKMMREMTMRRRRQVQAAALDDDAEDGLPASARGSRRTSARSPSHDITAASPTVPPSNTDVFHLPDVESLESSRHLTTTPSLNSSRHTGANHVTASSPMGLAMPLTVSASLTDSASASVSSAKHGSPRGTAPGAPKTFTAVPTVESEARKIPSPGRMVRMPSVEKGAAANLTADSAGTPLSAGTPAPATATPNGRAKASTPVPAPPARRQSATPVQSSNSFATAPSSAGVRTSSEKISPYQHGDAADSSLTSGMNAFDKYVLAGDSDSVNNSLVMHAHKPSNVAATSAAKGSGTSKVGTVVVGKPGNGTANPAEVASPKRGSASTSNAPPVVMAPSPRAVKSTVTPAATPSAAKTAPVRAAAQTPLPTPSRRVHVETASSNSSMLSPPSLTFDDPSVSVLPISPLTDVPSTAPQPPPTAANNTAAATATNAAQPSQPAVAAAAATGSANVNSTGGTSTALQPAKRGARNPLGVRTTTTTAAATTTPTKSSASPKKATHQTGGASATDAGKNFFLSSGSSDEQEGGLVGGGSASTSASPPSQFHRRPRQVQTILDEDDDVFTSSSGAPLQTMSLATPSHANTPPPDQSAKRRDIAAMQALGVNVSLDDEDFDDAEEDEEDEGLLDGFRPEGFDSKRGQRRSSNITFFLTSEDLEVSTSSSDTDSATARRGGGGGGPGFSAYNVSMSNTQVGVMTAPVSSRHVVPHPRVQVSAYVPAKGSALCAAPPPLPAAGNPYLVDAQAAVGNKASRRPTRNGTRPSSRASRNSLSNFDQSYGFALEDSATSMGSTPNAATWKLPKPQTGIVQSGPSKYAADPAKVHRPIANTFGRRRGGARDEDDDEDEEDDEYEYEYGDEEDGEWYWEEVEEEEDEEGSEQADADSDSDEPVIVKSADRRTSD